MKKYRFYAAAFLACLAIYPVSAQKNGNRDFRITKALNTHLSLFRELNRIYVDTVNPEALIKTGIDAMLRSLDPYTVFYPESNLDEVRMMTTGEYGGIGAVIGKHGDDIIIREPYTGTPSMKAGLLPGDILVSINGVKMKGKNTEEATNILRGPAGDEITLEIAREGVHGTFSVKLKREKVQLPNIPYYGMIQDSVGYIFLTGFTETSASDTRQAALDLKKRGATSLILDLRNNGGGLLDQAVDIVGMFVPQGSLVVSTKGRIPQIDKEMHTSQAPILPDMPLAVIINSGSASAAEIVSGALQDLDRAVLIGERSFGKGLVQNVRELPYNTKLKVTTAKYYIPSGRCIQAIDYSHRNPDGSVGKVPDSLKNEFRTAGGRIVYDGGGIQPDYETEHEEFSLLTQELVLKDIIFDFVNSYALTHSAPENVLDYELTESVFEEFKRYVPTKDFEYTTQSSKLTEMLEESAKNEKYLPVIEKQLEELKKALEPNTERDMELFEKEIREILRDQFITRYYNNEGLIEYTIKKGDDPDIKKAIEVLYE